MQHRTDEVPHDCGRRARARLAEQTAVRSRRVHATPIRPVFGRSKCCTYRQRSYPTGTSYIVRYMVLRRSSYPPNVITTVPKSKYARRYNVASNSSIPSVRRLLRSGPVAASARAPPSGLRGPGAREASTEEREPATTTHMPITCEMLSSGGCTCQHLRDQRPSTAHAQRRVL